MSYYDYHSPVTTPSPMTYIDGGEEYTEVVSSGIRPKNVTITGHEVQDIDIEKIVSDELEYLCIEKTHFTVIDLSPLASAINLKLLIISFNKNLERILFPKSLESSIKLHHIMIEGNGELESIESLPKSSSVREYHAPTNNLKSIDFSIFKSFPSLEVIDLYNNPLWGNYTDRFGYLLERLDRMDHNLVFSLQGIEKIPNLQKLSIGRYDTERTGPWMVDISPLCECKNLQTVIFPEDSELVIDKKYEAYFRRSDWGKAIKQKVIFRYNQRL